MVNLLILGIILFVIAFVLSMLGKGGGEFYVPIFITVGIAFQRAAATSLFILMVSGLTMMAVYHKKTLIDWKTGAAVTVSSATGSFIGGFISAGVNPLYLKLTFAILLFISALLIARPIHEKSVKRNLGPVWHRKCCGEEYEFPVLVVLPTIFFIGFIAGMVGISGGGLIVPLLIILGRMPMRTAFATNSIMVLFASGMGFLGHGLSAGVDWEFILTMASFVAVGAVFGAHYSSRVEIENLKRIFIIILIVAAFWMLYKALM